MSGRTFVRVRRLVACLVLCLGFWEARGAELEPSGTVEPVLADDADRVVYLPLEGQSLETARLREREPGTLERFLRGQKITSQPALLSYRATEVMQVLEPVLAAGLLDERCRKLEDDSTAPLLLVQVEQAVAADEQSEAVRLLKDARQALSCSHGKLTRQELSRLMVYSGLVGAAAADKVSWLMGAAAVDPLWEEDKRLPAGVKDQVRGVVKAQEQQLPAAEVRLPQADGPLWSMKSLFIDGRRPVFDKLFVTLVPGMHFVQVTLPDDRQLGAFIQVSLGEQRALVSLARDAMGLTARYQDAFQKALLDGIVREDWARGLRLYAAQLKRSQLLLAAITEEADGTWISVRRFHVERGLELVPFARSGSAELTPSTPVRMYAPLGLSAGLVMGAASGIGQDVFTPGAALSVEAAYAPAAWARLSVDFQGGLRSFQLRQIDGAGTPELGADLALGGALGVVRPLGTRLQLVADLGYQRHLVPFRGIPMYCDPQASSQTGDGLPIYTCTLESDASESSLLMNAVAAGGGPRLRVLLELQPRTQARFTLRGRLGIGYSPLLFQLEELSRVTIQSTDASGAVLQESAMLSLEGSSRRVIMQKLDLLLGINGTY